MLELYKAFYYNKFLNHWRVQERSKLEVDLHGFNRAMAYAALFVAFDEIRGMDKLGTKTLVVITGKNELGDHDQLTAKEKQNNDVIEVSEGSKVDEIATEDNLSYRLSDEIQQILIDEFYPPISSSTLPGNTGRIIISVRDIFRSA